MGNINLNLSITKLNTPVQGVSTFTYKDLGTQNIKILYKQDGKNQIMYVNDINTSNIDLNAIKASIRNIFGFIPGQSILQPQFGISLYKYIYQPMNSITQQNIKYQIKTVLQKFQPRINLTNIQLQKDQQNLQYNIKIEYIIPQLGKSSAQILSLSNTNGITIQD